MKKVSIIVPVYNVEKYVMDCLQSIWNQTYKNIEVLIVNDGATDNSEKLCRGFAADKENFHVFTKENGGLSDARNYGLKKATGDYIMFIDSDDIITPNMVEVLIENMEKDQVDISCCNMEMFFENGVKQLKHQIQENRVFSSEEAIEDVIFFGGSLDYSVCNKMFKKCIFENIMFPKGKHFEDMFILLSLFGKAERIYLDKTTCYKYRMRSNSITHSEFSMRSLDVLDVYSMQKEFLLKRNMNCVKKLEEVVLITQIELLNQIRTSSDAKKYRKTFKDIKAEIDLGKLLGLKKDKVWIKQLLLYLLPFEILIKCK